MRRKNRRTKSGRPNIKLGLPELEYVKTPVLNSLRSFESRRSYQHSIKGKRDRAILAVLLGCVDES